MSAALDARRAVRLELPSRSADSRNPLASCRGVRGEPNIGQQFLELTCGMGRQASEDILEVGEGIDIVVLAGPGQRVEDRCRPAAAVAPQEGPVAPADRVDAEHPLGEVVVDAQVPVLGVPQQRRPVRLRGGSLGSDLNPSSHKLGFRSDPCEQTPASSPGTTCAPIEEHLSRRKPNAARAADNHHVLTW